MNAKHAIKLKIFFYKFAYCGGQEERDYLSLALPNQVSKHKRELISQMPTKQSHHWQHPFLINQVNPKRREEALYASSLMPAPQSFSQPDRLLSYSNHTGQPVSAPTVKDCGILLGQIFYRPRAPADG